jgi:DNA-binding NarL/FixJ family response regulator
MCVDDHPIIRQGLSAVLATEPSDGQIQLALAAGARGCLHKGMPMTDVLAMIRKAHANRNRRGTRARVPFASRS